MTKKQLPYIENFDVFTYYMKKLLLKQFDHISKKIQYLKKKRDEFAKLGISDLYPNTDIDESKLRDMLTRGEMYAGSIIFSDKREKFKIDGNSKKVVEVLDKLDFQILTFESENRIINKNRLNRNPQPELIKNNGTYNLFQLETFTGKSRQTLYDWILRGVGKRGNEIFLTAEKIGSGWVVKGSDYHKFQEERNKRKKS